jgi:hypothetical protein
MALDQIVRCSDGHLYTMSAASRLFSVHLGARRLQRCAVDHRWRVAENVNPNDLSDAELTEARRHRAWPG